ncbi:Condensin-2 complex subunit H2 [Lamellibrachia satsuma]|nr:Condensin-2 complex subunit H2 [Lamellibrachia satsuma]
MNVRQNANNVSIFVSKFGFSACVRAAYQESVLFQQEQHLQQLAEEDEAEEVEVNAEVFEDDIDTGDAVGDDFVEIHMPPPDDVDSDRPATIMETETAIVSSFEDMVLNHVEGYLASAQQYVQTTELSRRVSEWANKIVPRLGIEEKRNTFDIHKYGTSVLNRLSESGATQSPQWIPFSKVVEGEPQYEVCRMLLASLQLANSSNMDISCDSDFDQTLNSLKMKLLTLRRHHEDLAEYCAPSTLL